VTARGVTNEGFRSAAQDDEQAVSRITLLDQMLARAILAKRHFEEQARQEFGAQIGERTGLRRQDGQCLRDAGIVSHVQPVPIELTASHEVPVSGHWRVGRCRAGRRVLGAPLPRTADGSPACRGVHARGGQP
jgi:hypothetical protein